MSEYLEDKGVIEVGTSLNVIDNPNGTSCTSYDINGGNHSNSDDDATVQQGFGGTSEMVGVLSPNGIVPGGILLKLGNLVSIQDTEQYHLMMGLFEAAKTPSYSEQNGSYKTEITNAKDSLLA